MPGFEEADKFKPSTSRTPALHLQFYSSVSVWRGTEGGGVDAHRKRHLNQDYLTPGNKREGAYGCCLDLIASQNTSEIANCELQTKTSEEEMAEMWWTEGASHRPSGRVGTLSTTRREMNASGLRGQAPFGV